MEFVDKEVYFDLYCPTCKYEEFPEAEDPCDECLSCPMNTHSHKPINWEEKENKKSS